MFINIILNDYLHEYSKAKNVYTFGGSYPLVCSVSYDETIIFNPAYCRNW